MSVRLLLVGAGGIGRAAHLPALAALRAEGRIDVVGICDIDDTAARAAATAHDIEHHGTDMARLAQQTRAQAVALAVPPGPNVALAVAALHLGLHVISEKPPARSVAQAQAMADTAAQHPQLVTMVAFNRRFAPLYRRAIAASRAIAPPHAFSGRFTRASLGHAPSNTAADWLTSDGSHALDLALATMGVPRRVTAIRQARGGGADNVWSIQLQSPAGSSTLTFDFAAGRRVERFEWSGCDYDVVLELPSRAEWSVRGQALETWTAAPGTSEPHTIAIDYGFVDEYRAFVDAIERGPRPAADFAYGVTFMRLVDTILQMASGEARDFIADEPPAVRSPAPPADVFVAAGGFNEGSFRSVPRRPEVLVLQNVAARQRQFDVGLLTAVADRAALHLVSGDEWKARLRTAHVVISGWGGQRLDRGQLEAATQLQLVVVVGSSAQSVAPEYLLARGVSVCTTADAVARSVAEHCLTLALAGLRRLTAVDRQMHQGGWPPAASGRFDYQRLKRRVRRLPGIGPFKPWLKPISQRIEQRTSGAAPAWRDLDGLVVGLIGWGHIARHFARLLAPFDCELLVHSTAADDEELRAHGARRASLGELLGAASVVSLHRGLTARTCGTLGAGEIDRLRPGAVLINTARAALVDETALIARLKRGDIIAALDVFEAEPLPASHPLRSLPNAILTPHNASSTPQCHRRAGTQALQLLLEWMDGKPVPALTAAQLAAMT